MLIFMLVFTGCAPAGEAAEEKPAGFFRGVMHGVFAPLTFILGLLFKSVKMYEPHNSGSGYDFGFYTAVCGGALLARYFIKKKSRRL